MTDSKKRTNTSKEKLKDSNKALSDILKDEERIIAMLGIISENIKEISEAQKWQFYKMFAVILILFTAFSAIVIAYIPYQVKRVVSNMELMEIK